jgi:glycosyltransferase involved in cell wall biosynthesis
VGLLRYIRRNGIDVVHCEKGPRNGLYGLLLSRLTRARYVAHFHWKYGNWMSRTSRFAVRRADAIIAVSSWTGRPIHVAGVPRERIIPVLNGIDVSAWDPTKVDGEAVRREFAVEPGDTVLVTVAQLVAWKRQAMLVEAFRRVAEERPRTRLLIVGKELAPPTAAGAVSYTDELRRLVAESGLEGQVVLTGRRSDVREILAAADIFTLPSVGDPCALAHIEAMAMAKPIVTVDSGGAPELVEHGKAGLVGPADDVEALTANLIALIDDPVKRRRFGDYGRQRVLGYLNAQRMADEVEAVYRLVVNGSSA